MYALSHPATTTQSDEVLYEQRLKGLAWVLAFQCLIMTMPTLKLLHLFGAGDWSWRWITVPFWGPSVVLALLLLAERVLGFRKAGHQLQLSYRRS
ncbi:MAG: hypothetical protein EOO60_03075 [Hymenobacter sp.]|nr:MAG: hypothetical protein EOO60_03075 [Hymenobacter sp.]